MLVATYLNLRILNFLPYFDHSTNYIPVIFHSFFRISMILHFRSCSFLEKLSKSNHFCQQLMDSYSWTSLRHCLNLDLQFCQIRSLDDSKTPLLLPKSQASQNRLSVYQTSYAFKLTISWFDLQFRRLALPKTSPVVNSNMDYSLIWACFSFEAANRGCYLRESRHKITALLVGLILAFIGFLTSMFFSQIVKLRPFLWLILPKQKKAAFHDYFFISMVSWAV